MFLSLGMNKVFYRKEYNMRNQILNKLKREFKISI